MNVSGDGRRAEEGPRRKLYMYSEIFRSIPWVQLHDRL